MVRDGHGKIQRLFHQKHRGALEVPQAHDEVFDLLDYGGLKSLGGFVQNQQLGLPD